MLDTKHSAAMYPAGHSKHWLHMVFLCVYEELDMPWAINAERQLQVSLLLLCTALQRQIDNSLLPQPHPQQENPPNHLAGC